MAHFKELLVAAGLTLTFVAGGVSAASLPTPPSPPAPSPPAPAGEGSSLPVGGRPAPERSLTVEPGVKLTLKPKAKALRVPKAKAVVRPEAKPKATPKPKPAPPAPVDLPSETVRLVSANIKTSMPLAAFQRDYSKVLASRPDFVALQEVPRRSREVLAVQGYEIYRGLHSPYTAETPVLWNTERWEVVSTGTRYLTERRVKWGVRAVNWATVKSRTTGRVVSVVSAHPAPTIKSTEGLLPIFIARLHGLVQELSTHGEVLVAGDLNVGYQGALWQRAGLSSSPLRATYDTLGRLPGGTGDHFGATIDYMMGLQSDTLNPISQGKWEQESDHDALWSIWELSSADQVLPADLSGLVLKPAS